MAKVMKRQGMYLVHQGARFLLISLVWLLLAGGLAVGVHPLLALLALPGALKAAARYTRYKKGLAGEQAVSQALMGLDDSYYIVHDAPIGGANIDHIVIGPNGIFVLETKHFSRRVECQGDRWWVVSRAGGSARRMWKSPSLQAKRNAAKVRNRIRKFERRILRGFPRVQWVHAMVVLSHPKVDLLVRFPTAGVVRLGELVQTIKMTRSPVRLPPEACTKIGFALLGMTEK